MWYRKSNDFMSGLIPKIKGAVNAPLINNKTVDNTLPYEGNSLESALEKLRNPEEQSIFDGNDTAPTVHKSNNSAQVAELYEFSPGKVPSNKPATLYSL